MKMQFGNRQWRTFGRALTGLLLVIAFLAVSVLPAQLPLNPGSGDTTGGTVETRPTPREPQYVPPLLSSREQEALSSAGSLQPALLLTGDAQSLEQFQEENAARRGNRYTERELQRLEEEGADDAFLQRALIEQYGAATFPRNFGEHPYHETPSRRFATIFILSLPFTIAASLGVIGLAKLTGGNTEFNSAELLGGGLVALGLSGGVAYYDYNNVYGDRLEEVGSRRNHPAGIKGDFEARYMRELPPMQHLARTMSGLLMRELHHAERSTPCGDATVCRSGNDSALRWQAAYSMAF